MNQTGQGRSAALSIPNWKDGLTMNHYASIAAALHKTKPMRFTCFAAFMPEYGFVWCEF